MCMINEARVVLGDILCHNDAMRRTQEVEEDIQHQEESWREVEKLGKHKKNQKNERNKLK